MSGVHGLGIRGDIIARGLTGGAPKGCGCSSSSSSSSPRRSASNVVAGDDPVPHQDDWWVSTEDVLDYAHWMTRKVDDVDRVMQSATRSASGAQLGKVVELNAWWMPWAADWRGLAHSLETSTWERINAWDRIRTKHQELRAFIDRARAAGVKVSTIEGVPDDAQALKNMAKGVGSFALPPLALIAVGLVAAAVISRKL